jgi:hypothetical protein
MSFFIYCNRIVNSSFKPLKDISAQSAALHLYRTTALTIEDTTLLSTAGGGGQHDRCLDLRSSYAIFKDFAFRHPMLCFVGCLKGDPRTSPLTESNGSIDPSLEPPGRPRGQRGACLSKFGDFIPTDAPLVRRDTHGIVDVD